MLYRVLSLILLLLPTLVISNDEFPKYFKEAFDPNACTIRNEDDLPTFHKKVKPLQPALLGTTEFFIRSRLVQKGLEPTEWKRTISYPPETRYSLETRCPVGAPGTGPALSLIIYEGNQDGFEHRIGDCSSAYRENPKYLVLAKLLQLVLNLNTDADDTGPYLYFSFRKDKNWRLKEVLTISNTIDGDETRRHETIKFKERMRPDGKGAFSFHLFTSVGDLLFNLFQTHDYKNITYKHLDFSGHISKRCFQANTEIFSQSVGDKTKTVDLELQVGAYLSLE